MGTRTKVAGVNIDDPQEKEKIYQLYLKAFKIGVYNYIKEDRDPSTQERIPRRYFSGGASFANAAMLSAFHVTHDQASVSQIKFDHSEVVQAKLNDVSFSSMDRASRVAAGTEYNFLEVIREVERHFNERPFRVLEFNRTSLTAYERLDMPAYLEGRETPYATDHLYQLIGYGSEGDLKFPVLVDVFANKRFCGSSFKIQVWGSRCGRLF